MNYQKEIIIKLKENGYYDRISQHQPSLYQFCLIRNSQFNTTIFYNKKNNKFGICKITIKQVREAYKILPMEKKKQIFKSMASVEIDDLHNDNLSIHIYNIDIVTKYFTNKLIYNLSEEDLYNYLIKE